MAIGRSDGLVLIGFSSSNDGAGLERIGSQAISDQDNVSGFKPRGSALQSSITLSPASKNWDVPARYEIESNGGV